MKRFLLLAIAQIFVVAAYAQKNPLINSGEVIERGKAKYDSGKYEEAIADYLLVAKRDTNYVYMVTELALAYVAAKKYDSALARCKEGLSKPSIYRNHFLRTTATALDNKGDFDQAVAAMKKASEEYPFDATLIYNLGITYYNHKDYEKAEECFFKTLSINPFHSGSHLNLGRLSIGQGKKTHAIFSLAMYLAISTKDNDRLVLLDKMLSNQVPDEGTFPQWGNNGCEKLDQILKAKIAMDKNFKTKVPVDAAVVRQTEMFFEQLSTISTTSDDRWVAHYLPIYKTFKEKNVIEPFLYLILSSAKNDQVKKWHQKNEKELKEFFVIANKEISQPRNILTVPSSFGYDKPVQAWYFDNNRLESIGMKDASGEKDGQWYFYHDNYQLSAEGKFKAGKKIGKWKYYRSDGTLKSDENYDTGEVTVISATGAKTQHFFLKGDNINGEVELFHIGGGTKEKLVYKEGKRHGTAQSYYPNGKKNSTYQYSEDILNGLSEEYYDNGQMFSKVDFKNDLRVGPYVEYHANGKVKMSGQYVDGKVDGTWKYYYVNGKVQRTGNYKVGNPIGEWTYYDEHGDLDEKRNFDNEGDWHGDNTHYHNGKIYNVLTFKKEVIVKTIYYDENGKEVFKAGNDKGDFQSKTFYPTGQLAGEGSYRKGKIHGSWTYYYPEGMKQSEYTYEDGDVQGNITAYYRNGEKQTVSVYKDDELHGYYTSYHINGKVKSEGWYQDGQRQQRWLDYFGDGTIDSDYYYLNDEISGAAYDYSSAGKLLSIAQYDNGLIDDFAFFNSEGKKASTARIDGAKKIYEVKYASGKNKYQFITAWGDQNERFTKWLPDGHVFFTFDIMNTRRHGAYAFYSIDNQIETKGQYINGSREGVWSGYINSRMEYQGKYLNGKTDSTWTYYQADGKIASLVNYRNDKRHGINQINAPDGTPVLEKLYDLDNLISYRFIGSDGKLGEWVKFKGDATIIVNYPSGGKVFEETYKNGLHEGPRRSYFANGSVCSEYNYKWDNYEGSYKEYYSNGKLKEKRNYKNDEMNGLQEYYNEDGTLFKTEEYVNGYREGKSILYKNGVKVKEVIFWGNDPVN